MKKLIQILLFSCCLFGAFFVQAQTIKVSGVVSDDVGDPLPGASVVIKGTTTGTTTGVNGNYTLSNVPADAILVFSFIGLNTQEIPINGQATVNVKLTTSIIGLDDIVVIGYGQVKKKDATGSVAVVSEDNFQKGFIKSPAELIANKVPGVRIVYGGGASPSTTIRIRGGSSLNASNDPLIVIDGVPTQNAGELNKINPDDIASFSVLKDASATAIYGSRGSNGVIIVSTKKGVSSDLKFTFSSKFSMSEVVTYEDVLTGDEYRELALEAAEVAGTDISAFDIRDGNTNWQDEIFRKAFTKQYNFSMTGGLGRFPYRLSLGLFDNEGVLDTDKYTRWNGGLNINPSLFENHLKANINLKISQSDARWADQRAFKAAITFNPTIPVYDETSPYGGYSEYYIVADNPALLHGHYNPVAMLHQNKETGETLGALGNIQLDYKFHFLEDLRANINFGYELGRFKSHEYRPVTNFESNHVGGVDLTKDPGSEKDNITFEGYLNYVKEIPSADSKIDVMGGYSYYDYKNKNYNYPSFNVAGDTIVGTIPAFEYDIPRNTLISFYGRLNYQLKERYILTATVRRDGSSRFSEENRWGVFPSAALAWRIVEEEFMQGAKNLSDLKLRVGYGVTGQQDGIGNYGYITNYNLGQIVTNYPFGNNWITSIYPAAADKNRKWEETATYNIALEWGFFNQRLSGTLEVYKKETSDLLNNVNIPLGSNFASNITRNIGSMKNTGIEVAIDAIPVKKEGLTWSLGFNFNYNENEITSLTLDDTNPDALQSGDRLVSAVGHGRNAYYLYHQVYDADGNPIEDAMLDVNNDGIINQDDKYIDKSSIPKFLMGFNTSINYKKWSIDMAFHSNIGHYMFYGPVGNEWGPGLYDNLFAIYSNATAPRNINRMWFDHRFVKSTNQYQGQSDLYLQNASFVKMDNINVNYSVGEIFQSINSRATLSLNASIQNVFTITNYTGKDPENAGWGVDGGENYPRPRTITVGLNLQF